MKKSLLARWRDSFLTGVVVILPGVVTFAVIKWLAVTVSSLTDLLLFFLPAKWTHAEHGHGPMHWYWSLAALAVAIVLVTAIGLFSVFAFDAFFIAFHGVFFKGDTWLFNYSDSLIQFYPELFWMKASYGIALFVLFGAILFTALGAWLMRRKAN